MSVDKVAALQFVSNKSSGVKSTISASETWWCSLKKSKIQASRESIRMGISSFGLKANSLAIAILWHYCAVKLPNSC